MIYVRGAKLLYTANTVSLFKTLFKIFLSSYMMPRCLHKFYSMAWHDGSTILNIGTKQVKQSSIQRYQFFIHFQHHRCPIAIGCAHKGQCGTGSKFNRFELSMRYTFAERVVYVPRKTIATHHLYNNGGAIHKLCFSTIM